MMGDRKITQPRRSLWTTLMLGLVVGWLSILIPAVEALHSTDTITSGGDNTRSGYQTNHNLDPAVVASSQFGIIWRKKLLGRYNGWTEQIFAQALVYTPDNSPGSDGEPQQYVYVASQMNMIYKVDAVTGDILLSRNLHIPFLVSDLDGCNDISYCIGSTATGVIDPETHTWYITTKTYRDQTGVEKGRLNGRYYIHAIDTRTLEEKPNFPVDLEGVIATNNPIRMFQGGIHHQRPALMQYGEWIYAGFASHCVQYNFTGWVIGWHRESGEIIEAFATEGGPEDKKGGGIWMSGGGLASDVPGRMLFATGNGYASQLDTIPVPGRQPPTALEEAVVHMKIGDDGRLSPVDFFIPWEKTALDGADKDLGTSGIALLDPKVFTSPLVKRIGCITGKSGKLYFLNLDDLGGYQMGPNKKDAVLQVVELKNSVFSTAGSYPGNGEEGAYVYINVVQHESVVFKFSVGPNGEPIFTQVAETAEKTAYVLGVGHGTTTSLNRQPGTGLYWVTDIQGLNLRVYNAVPMNGKLQLIKGLNIPGQIKFSRPTFGNGRAYLTTSTGDLVMVGSPVNPPLLCDTPVQFGEVTMGDDVGIDMEVSCLANIATTVTEISLRVKADFKLSDLPILPRTLVKGQNVTFRATFLPTGPGPLSDDVQIATNNGVANYAENTPVALRGIGRSLNPILFISPNTVSFPGTITGANPDGIERSFVIYNQGDSDLQITDYDLSSVSESGPWLPEGSLVAGPYTFGALPTTIPSRGSVTINVNFNPTANGNYGAYLLLKSNGGNKYVTIVGTSGGYPVAKLEFEKPDGSGWVEFNKSDPDFAFDFGTVYQQETRTLNLRLTNAGDPDAAILGVTVSKPPIGAGQVVGSRNGVDLGEGTQLLAGESANATLFCSVPKSQVNVDSYIANTTWTMNLGDPTFGKHDLLFVCNAVAEQGGPLYSNGQGRYRYIGCFKENNPSRQLAQQLYGSSTLTNGQCMQDCFSHTKNFKYAGTQYHRECWCGDQLPNLRADDEDCNFDCSGNGTQICGGNGYFGGGAYISLFGDIERVNGSVPSVTVSLPPSSTTTPPTPTINPGNDVFGYAGCYAEPSSGGRALSSLWGSDDLTVAACLARCPTANYIGVEYGRECWCGTTIRAEAVLRDDKECNMLCKGNPGEYCGAGGRLNLYTRKSATSTTRLVPNSDTTTEPITTSTIVVAEETSTTTATITEGTPIVTSTPIPEETSMIRTTTSVPSSEPTIHPGIAAYRHIGCYTDATTGRTLGGKLFATDDLTVPVCIEYCETNGFPYAGVEYGRECWCGTEFGIGAVLAEQQGSCSMPCKGDPGTYCGGAVRLNVYQISGGDVNSSALSETTTKTIVEPGETSSLAVSLTTTTTSTAIPTPTGWAYLGCANETTSRALSGASLSLDKMTIPLCLDFCLTHDLPLAGVEYGNECHCGTALPSTSQLNQIECSLPCAGDAAQTCGGSQFLNVYNYTLHLPPVTPRAVGEFVHQGCYTEVSGRTVSGYSFTNTTHMTVEMCVERCDERGWNVAGVEYMHECYCSNAMKSNSEKVGDNECGMLCKGNKREYCGGSSRVGVYIRNGAVVL